MKVTMILNVSYTGALPDDFNRCIHQVILNDLMAPNSIDRPFGKLTSALKLAKFGFCGLCRPTFYFQNSRTF